MEKLVRKTIKFTAGVCAAAGIVALGSVVAGGAAVRVVAEGLKGAKNAMEKTIKEIQAENEGKTITVDEATITEADFVTENKEQE